MKLSELSINRAVTFSMIFIAISIFGVVAMMGLSPELLPDITFPAASVMVSYEGVGPEDIEKMVARPLEEGLSTITGVNDITVTCKEGMAIIMLMFDWGTDMDAAASDIRERLDMFSGRLPSDASDPITFKFDVSMQPIIFLGISSDRLDPAKIRKLSEDKIEPFIERVEGVAMASTMGGSKREIQVQVDQGKMEQYGLSIQRIAGILRGENLNMPADKGISE